MFNTLEWPRFLETTFQITFNALEWLRSLEPIFQRTFNTLGWLRFFEPTFRRTFNTRTAQFPWTDFSKNVQLTDICHAPAVKVFADYLVADVLSMPCIRNLFIPFCVSCFVWWWILNNKCSTGHPDGAGSALI